MTAFLSSSNMGVLLSPPRRQWCGSGKVQGAGVSPAPVSR
ncbi:hypothetical protein I546_3209 [Mycobacterium kansasii 732]|nr:hypothetical protein I546_3209 [Mycobacterium kansasii 732]